MAEPVTGRLNVLGAFASSGVISIIAFTGRRTTIRNHKNCEVDDQESVVVALLIFGIVSILMCAVIIWMFVSKFSRHRTRVPFYSYVEDETMCKNILMSVYILSACMSLFSVYLMYLSFRDTVLQAEFATIATTIAGLTFGVVGGTAELFQLIYFLNTACRNMDYEQHYKISFLAAIFGWIAVFLIYSHTDSSTKNFHLEPQECYFDPRFSIRLYLCEPNAPNCGFDSDSRIENCPCANLRTPLNEQNYPMNYFNFENSSLEFHSTGTLTFEENHCSIDFAPGELSCSGRWRGITSVKLYSLNSTCLRVNSGSNKLC